MNNQLIAIALALIVASFGFGYYKGKNSEFVKYTLESQKDQIAQLKNKITQESNINNIIRTQSSSLENQLIASQGEITNVKNQIAKYKEYIDATNTISTNFVQYIQKSDSSVHTYAAPTHKSSSADKTVSADRVLYFIKDLQLHDTVCTNKYNTLLNVYNQEMLLINK